MPVLNLVSQLCQMLEAEGISYCHWKSNVALERSATGENDLDLLVDRSSAQRFTEILFRCGFKEAWMPPVRQVPGILDYYGYEPECDRLIHVHVHYQLILGHDATKNYHLPIEKPFLASSVQTDLFCVPAPEFELIVFIIRMALKHSSWEAILRRRTGISAGERQELVYLQAQVDTRRMLEILAKHFPYLNREEFADYLQSIQPGTSGWVRARAGIRLQNDLRTCARRPPVADELLKLWRYLAWGIQRRVLKHVTRRRLANGGGVIALVGGDGSGKSTAVEAVDAWLSRCFEISKVHMGKPSWSFTTVVVRGLLKIGTVLGLYPFSIQDEIDLNSTVFPGYPALIRAVCTARDRYLTYKRARRFASNGGLVICDRFSLPGIMAMDGPQIERMTKNSKTNRFIRLLLKLEEKYYRQITLPDLLAVLRVNPEVAVQRKTTEDAVSVRARTTQVWVLDWETTPAHVIDASQPAAQVLCDLKTLIWSNL